MTEEAQASLHDVFQLFDKDHHTKQTSYILQFLWRDLTSSFDIVGPHYTSNDSKSRLFLCISDYQVVSGDQTIRNASYVHTMISCYNCNSV